MIWNAPIKPTRVAATDYPTAKHEVRRALMALRLEAPQVVVDDVQRLVETAFRLADEAVAVLEADVEQACRGGLDSGL